MARQRDYTFGGFAAEDLGEQDPDVSTSWLERALEDIIDFDEVQTVLNEDTAYDRLLKQLVEAQALDAKEDDDAVEKADSEAVGAGVPDPDDPAQAIAIAEGAAWPHPT